MANKEIRDIVFRLQVNTADGTVKIDGLTKGFVKAETALGKMKTTLNETNEAIKGTGSISGLASTAVLEFGRTLSDAPYGIQGMANNVTQLVTIVGQLSEKAKATGESMSQAFGKALKGPLGIVILVQGAILALELLAKKQDDVASSSRKLAEAVATSAVGLKLAKNALEDENVSLEQKEAIIGRLNEEYPDFNLTLEESGKLSEENAGKIDQEIDALGRLAKARAYQSLLEEEYAKQAKILTDANIKDVGVWDMLVAGIKNYGSATSGAVEVGQALGKELQDSQKNITALEAAIKDEGLVELLIGSDKKGKLTKEKRDKVKKLVLDVYDTTFAEMEKRKKYADEVLERLGVPDIPTLLTGGPEGIKKLREGITGLYQEVEKVPLDYSGVGTSFGEIVEAWMPAVAEVGNLLAGEAERAIAIETNKTNRINDELRKRLANEQLSADERDKINQQIAKNEAALVEKENKINKKRFEQEKAFSIVQATVNTYLAASDVLAREKMGAVGKAIAAAAIIATGLAQVAAISRQQFTAKAMPAPNLTGQGGGIAGGGAPDFNVIGGSTRSQVAEAIAGTRNEPIKAYVVSSEVSSAQELDRKIVAGASI